MHGIGLILSLHMLLFDLGILTEGHYIMMGRHAGLVEYANTFGLLLATLFFYGLIQSEQTQNKWLTYLHLSVLPMYLFMVLKSQSRGVLLFSSVVFIIMTSLSKTKQQLKLLLEVSLALITALILYVAINPNTCFDEPTIKILSDIKVPADEAFDYLPSIEDAQTDDAAE